MEAVVKPGAAEWRAERLVKPDPGIAAEARAERSEDWDFDFDDELEDDLIFLLSCLEQLMSRLREPGSETPPPPTLQLIAEMVNRTVAMAENIVLAGAHAVSLPQFLQQAGHQYPLVRLLPVKGNRLGEETVSGVGQGQMGWLAGSRTSLRQVCQGLISTMESYFSLFETSFHSPQTRARWKETYRVFIVDLTHTLTGVRA